MEGIWETPTEAEALDTEIVLIEALGTKSGSGYNMTPRGFASSGSIDLAWRATIAQAAAWGLARVGGV